MDIPALLNPESHNKLDLEPQTRLRSRVSFTANKARPLSKMDTITMTKKKKNIDNVKLEEGPPRLEVRFPPHEATTEDIKNKHQEIQLSPAKDIGSYVRHIPYKSSKRTFEKQTGRDCLEGKLKVAVPQCCGLADSLKYFSTSSITMGEASILCGTTTLVWSA